jgi:hypothetical protein
MHALAVFPERRRVAVIEEDEPPTLGPRQILLRTREVGVCDTDVRSPWASTTSIGGGGDGPAIHRPLLESDICVIEGLDLSLIAPGLCDLICLPLRIHDADGAPARVLPRPRVPVTPGSSISGPSRF